MHPNINPCVPHGHRPSPDSHLRERWLKQIQTEVVLCPAKQEGCALEMGVDSSLISHWSSGRCDMPAWRLIRWTRTYGAGLLRWIARQCGFEIISVSGEPSPQDAEALVALFARQSGAAVAQTIQSIASGGEWTSGEKAQDLRTWKQTQSFVNGIVDALEREVR